MLVLALPLLPTGYSEPSLSKSSVRASPSSQLLDGIRQAEFGDEAAAHGDLGLAHRQRVAPDLGQAGSVHLMVNSRSEKRPGFTPWGGKRTLGDTGVWKRLKFQPWGGKRFARRAVANKRISAYFDDSSKREFHPWGGKRSV